MEKSPALMKAQCSHRLSEKPTPSVQLNRVGLRYGRGMEVLSDVNFTLERGSFNFITGPSGAGKTSLLKLIYLHVRPSRGLITLFGSDVSQLPLKDIPILKRRMGVVLRDFRLIDYLSVFENVALPLRVLGRKRPDYIDDVTNLLEWVGLGKRMRALPPTLSAGEKQRTAIARAVIARPEILIADEPTGNVDHEIGQRLIRLFAELNRLGTTVIIATHDHGLIPEDVNILSLKNGAVVMTGHSAGLGGNYA